MLFNKYNKKDILGDVLSNLDFSPSFEQCLERKLIYEACKLAIAHKQREKFDSIISQIKPEELRKKLEMEFK